MKRWYILTLIILGVLAVMAYPYEAQAIHRGAGGLVCGQCHTMHNSQGGQTLDGPTPYPTGGGGLILLRGDVSSRAEIHQFCLNCHSSDGAQFDGAFAPHTQAAPKVLLDSSLTNKWTEADYFNIIGAGGDFQYACGDKSGLTWDCVTNDGTTVGNGRGHSLGMTTVTPPGGGSAIGEFSCTSCHDPHGTDGSSTYINFYRNLKVQPTGMGTASEPLNNILFTDGSSPDGATAPSSYIGGVTGTFATTGNYIPVSQATGVETSGATATAIWPLFKDATYPPVAANSNAYTGDIAGWCVNCHDAWHEDTTANSPSNNAGGAGAAGDWRRHPVDEVISTVGPANQSGAGVTIIDVTNYNAAIAGQSLPVVNGGGANGLVYYRDDDLDRVFCFSCHFVHGGPYYDNLRWNYTSAVSPGAQTGNMIASNRGCQLCHNRGG